jgi:hypothetical protein
MATKHDESDVIKLPDRLTHADRMKRRLEHFWTSRPWIHDQTPYLMNGGKNAKYRGDWMANTTPGSAYCPCRRGRRRRRRIRGNSLTHGVVLFFSRSECPDPGDDAYRLSG